MKYSKVLPFSLLFLLLLTSCHKVNLTNQENAYQLYYIKDLDPSKDLITGAILHPVRGYNSETVDSLTPFTLIALLMVGPENNGYVSALPNSLSIYSLELSDSGLLSIQFSSEYGELSGINRTISDYALTLTLTQLPTVSALRITVFGEENTYQNTVLRSNDLVVSSLIDTNFIAY